MVEGGSMTAGDSLTIIISLSPVSVKVPYLALNSPCVLAMSPPLEFDGTSRSNGASKAYRSDEVRMVNLVLCLLPTFAISSGLKVAFRPSLQKP